MQLVGSWGRGEPWGEASNTCVDEQMRKCSRCSVPPSFMTVVHGCSSDRHSDSLFAIVLVEQGEIDADDPSAAQLD